jgi:Zn-dependent peptidase ImmA (M78 family)
MAFIPKHLSYSSEGVPILSAQEVEDVATEVLQKHCPDVLRKPAMAPVIDLIQAIGKTTAIKSTIEDLGFRGQAKILGKVSFAKKILFLDISLTAEREVQMRFTAAHELGHWVLHRWNYKNWKFPRPNYGRDDLEDDEKSLCRLDERTSQDWLEWQANVFAASLVLPRGTFQKALIETQETFGITRNLGTVWVSDAEYSRRDFQLVGSRLANIYGVSLTSIRIRLNTLKLLHDEGASHARSALQILHTAKPPDG